MITKLREELKVRGVWWIAFIALIIFITFKKINDKDLLKSKHHYAVGVIINKYKGIKQPLPTIEFEYYLSNKKYIRAQAFNPDINSAIVGTKYLIIFSPSEPDNSRMLLKVPLNDSIQAPNEGWSEAPFGLKESKDIEW
jgi:hypothetical protein